MNLVKHMKQSPVEFNNNLGEAMSSSVSETNEVSVYGTSGETFNKPEGKKNTGRKRRRFPKFKREGGSDSKSILTSMQVFLMFVKYNENGQCDASAVISKECFEKWVNTRKDKPKCPEESFRRTLTAHLVGRDLRRPFPPEAEASILQVIRQRKPWACFQGSKIGVQGFKQLAYHERARLENNDEISKENIAASKRERHPAKVDTLSNVPIPAATEDILISEALDIIESQSLGQYYEDEIISNEMLILDEIKGFDGVYEEEGVDVFLANSEGPKRPKKPDNLDLNVKTSIDLFENQYWKNFELLNPQALGRLKAVKDMIEHIGGVNWKWWLTRNRIDPTLHNMANNIPNMNDIRYSREFLVPDEAFFRTDRPLGTFIRNFAGVMLDNDQHLRDIQETDLRGRESSNMLINKLHMLCSYMFGAEKLHKTGNVWLRQIIVTSSGRLKVVLANVTVQPNGIIKVLAQDCSDQFPYLRQNY